MQNEHVRYERRERTVDMDFANLTDEQKAKAEACKTPADILALAQEEGYERSDEELEGISGGWRATDQKGCPDRCGCLCPRV